jgi:hypothetical protein
VVVKDVLLVDIHVRNGIPAKVIELVLVQYVYRRTKEIRYGTFIKKRTFVHYKLDKKVQENIAGGNKLSKDMV